MTKVNTFLCVASLFALVAVAGYGPALAVGEENEKPAPVADGDQGDQNEQPQMQEEDEAEPESEPNLSDGAADLAEQFLERMRNLGRRNPNEKSHAKILTAFNKITSPPSYSTAMVFSGDEPAAMGTIVSKDGYILTKASELSEDLSCRLRDGRHLPAELVGVHADHDLAMLKITADDLTPIVWHEGDEPTIGTWLATTGIEDQPLAIGIVSATVRRIRQTPGVLGVSLEDGEGGAKIAEVMRKSAAQSAGLKKGDLVVRVDEKEIKGRADLVNTIRKHKPGDIVKLKVVRGDEELELDATLGASFPTPAGRGDIQNNLGGSLSERRAGFAQVIQHDTVLEPHECGGPVVDLEGKAVGINIARAGRVNSYALPASVVVDVIEDLKSGKLAPLSPQAKRLAELEREIQQVSESVEQKNALKAETMKTLREVESSLEDLEKAIAAAKAAREAAQKNADAASANLDEMKANLEKLEAERDQLKTE